MRGGGAGLLFLCFLPIACGADWFGLLTARASRLVGAVSYSLYLLNIVVFFWLTRLWAYGGSSQATLALAETGLLFAAVMVSLLTYRTIELPFMRRSKGAPAFAGVRAAAAP